MTIGFRFRQILQIALLLTALLIGAAQTSAGAPAPADDEEIRRSTTRQIPSGGRDGQLTSARQDTYPSLRRDSVRSKPSADSSAKSGGGSVQSRSTENDFWFFAADVELFNDDDGDGFFHGIDLLFDADTVFDEVDVFAVAFLSLDGGPFDEYASTDVFTISGATSDDEFVIVTELTTGYPTGSYDLLIELYDAFNGEFLTSIGPEDTSELSFLPLEDFERDAPFPDQVVIVDGGGGSASALTIAALLCGLLLARRRRMRRMLQRAVHARRA